MQAHKISTCLRWTGWIKMSTNLQNAKSVQEALPISKSVDGLVQRKCECGTFPHRQGQLSPCSAGRRIAVYCAGHLWRNTS